MKQVSLLLKSCLKVGGVGADATECACSSDRERAVAECWTAGGGYDQLRCCCRTWMSPSHDSL